MVAAERLRRRVAGILQCMAAIALDHVSKRYVSGGEPAVCDLCLQIDDGEFLVIVGPSGCGKSSTLRMIAGLELPTSGEVLIGGRTMRGVPPRDRRIAMVFQDHSLYPHLTARENLAFALRMRRLDKAEIERRVAATADMLGVGSLLQARPGELSGGERQRIALGKALVQLPEARCLLFDEPLASLDTRLRASLRTELKQLHNRLRFTAVYVTHDQDEALTLGDRAAVMNRGMLEQVGPPRVMYGAPINRFVAGFIGSPAMNFIDGTVSTHAGRAMFTESGTGGVRIALHARTTLIADGTRCTLGVRPHDLTISTEATPPADDSMFIATITLIEPVGEQCNVHLATGAGTRLVARCSWHEALSPGADVHVGLNAGRIHLFDELGSRTSIVE